MYVLTVLQDQGFNHGLEHSGQRLLTPKQTPSTKRQKSVQHYGMEENHTGDISMNTNHALK